MPLSRASCKTLCPCPFCHTLLSLDTPLLDCAVFFSVFLFLSFKRSCHWVFGPSVGGLGFLDSQFSLQKPEQEEWSGPSRSGDSDDIEQSQARRAFHQGPSVCIRCPPMVSPILAATPPPPPPGITWLRCNGSCQFWKVLKGNRIPWTSTGLLYDLLPKGSQPHPSQLGAAALSHHMFPLVLS